MPGYHRKVPPGQQTQRRPRNRLHITGRFSSGGGDTARAATERITDGTYRTYETDVS